VRGRLPYVAGTHSGQLRALTIFRPGLVVSVFMKTLTEYLGEAIKFEHMANDAIDVKAKAAFKNQAVAYRKLAIQRAEQLGVPVPDALSEQK